MHRIPVSCNIKYPIEMSIYKRFLSLSERWPKHPVIASYCADLGTTIAKRIESKFHYGSNTQISNVEDCEKIYQSLSRLQSGHHRSTYRRKERNGFMDCNEDNISDLVNEAVAMLKKKRTEMLIKEYRIPMPMSVEEYKIAQLYMIQRKSREESQGEGSGVEILENRPYENGLGGSGQYTRKIYHISTHIPGWFVAILPKNAMIVYEEAWNAYPHTRTRFTCPFIEKFSIDIETKYCDDPGDRDDVFEGNPGRAVDLIDMVKDQSGDKVPKEEDTKIFKSLKTGRGPLTDDWLSAAKKNHGKSGNSVMCSYKLCKVEFKYWGMQSKIEKFIHDVALRKTMGRAHRQAWCWQDEWYGLTMEDIRRLERETQSLLEKKFGATGSTAENSPEHSLNMEEPPVCSLLSQVIDEVVASKTLTSLDGGLKVESPAIEKTKRLSASSFRSSHSRNSKRSSVPALAEWRMQSIERDSESSDDDEFFDAIDMFPEPSPVGHGLQTLIKEQWGSTSSLDDDAASDAGKIDGDISPSIAYQTSLDEDGLSQIGFHGHLTLDRCKIDTLFLVLHGGNPLESLTDEGFTHSSKEDDLATLSSTFNNVASSHYRTAMGRFAFRLIKCPKICSEACDLLKSLRPTGDNSQTVSSTLVSVCASYGIKYGDAVNATLNQCNSAFQSFLQSKEGKGFNGQVCIIADSVGGLFAYDMLNISSEFKRRSSHGSFRRGSSLSPHEEENRFLSSNSLPSSPKLRFTYENGDLLVARNVSLPDFDPLKVPSLQNRRYSANYCLDVQRASPKRVVNPASTSSLSRRSSSGMSIDSGGSTKLDFEVYAVFVLGCPLGGSLALRSSIIASQDCLRRPACGRFYNVFYPADPSSSRVEPLIDTRFSQIDVVDIPRYHKYPLGDGKSLTLGDALAGNLDAFLDNDRNLRRGSEYNVTSCTGEELSNINEVHDHQIMEKDEYRDVFEDKPAPHRNVAAKWFGDQRLDFALFCPESLSSFPVVSLPHLFYASFWESTDLAAFIIRQVVHQENMAVCLDCENQIITFTPSIPREKWHKRRTHVKIRNMTANHRGKDSVAIEDGDQVLCGRFTYGPLDVVSLSGEKVDIYINNMSTTSAAWVHVATSTTDSNGKINCIVPPEKRMPLGIFPVKMVVRGDLTIADSYLVVIPPHTDCVIFSIDGSFAASVSLMGSDPKVQPGSVDVVRQWQDLGYLIIYVTARPNMQKHRVVTWLAHHNFPHGPVWFSDALSHEPMKQKTNLLKQLQQECKLNYAGGYGSSKDISVYNHLGLTNDKIFIIGKISKKQASQCMSLSDGYALHLRQLKENLRPAKYNIQIASRKGCFGLPGSRTSTKSKSSTSKKSTSS